MATRFALFIALLAGALMPRLAPAEAEGTTPARLVGAAQCGSCHQAEARAWAAGPHGTATTGEATADARCVACHATGGGPASAERLPGVQCEACHGPGAAYSPADVMRNLPLARALGLRDLSSPAARAASCGACHRARTRVRPFDAERAWREFGHGPAADAAITPPHAGP